MILSQLRQVLRHVWSQQRWFLCSLFAALLLAGFVFRSTGRAWWDWAEAIISLAALVVGFVIWYTEAQEDWEESLPKRLTAEFWFASSAQGPRLVMACRRASLVGESDIRTWAIALGAQMDGGKRQLKYQPFFTLIPPEIVVVRITLDELPERLAQLEAAQGHPLWIEWTYANGHQRENVCSPGLHLSRGKPGFFTMPKDANYIAAYDLASDRERERVSRVLEGYGFRVQFSVFELRLTRGLRERLLADLKQLELKSGFIYLYRRDATARRYEAGVVPPRPHDESNHSYVL